MIRGPRPQALLLDKDGPIVPLTPTWSTWATDLLTRLSDLAPRVELAGALGVDPHDGTLDPDGLLAVGTVAAVAAALTSVVGSVTDRPAGEVRRVVRDAIAAADGGAARLTLRPDPDLIRLLATCRASRLPVAVVTNDDRESTVGQLGGLGVTGLIDVVVCGDDGHEPKPSGSMLLAACGSLGVEAPAALMVGDTLVDLLAAEDAGTGFALLRSSRPRWLPDRATFVESLSRLAQVVAPAAGTEPS